MPDQLLHLIHEFTIQVSIGPPHEVGASPFGHRQYFEMTGGHISGSRLSGKLLGSGSDWMLVGPDGFMRMDVRIQIETDDGAVILAHYFGPAEAGEKLRQALTTFTPTEFADHSLRSHWVLESGDPRYAWVNQAVFVGQSRFFPPSPNQMGFEHQVYRLS